ncbi:hypothetical protein BTR23_23515 [Alkalihalophilus pseudofirmus]|nr:hypothetical protein BTR23_23515 [Alkalihalophilus pseudofirmus]
MRKTIGGKTGSAPNKTIVGKTGSGPTQTIEEQTSYQFSSDNTSNNDGPLGTAIIIGIVGSIIFTPIVGILAAVIFYNLAKN